MNNQDVTLILDILKRRARGIKNAKTLNELSLVSGLCRRTVEKRISILRSRGYPILSNCDIKRGPLGMFIAKTDKQVEAWGRQMNSRIAKVSHHRKRVSNKFYQRHQAILSLR